MTTLPKTKTIIRSLLAVALIIGVYVAIEFILVAARMVKHSKSEYPTAHAIGAVTVFVEKNQGQWPTSWDDLAFPADQRGMVHLQFDVTAGQILATPELIYSVITPVTGPYRVYPHSKEDLDYLLGRVRALNEGKGD